MRTVTVARKELRQLSRDPRTLAILLIVPALLLLFYGYVLTLDVRNLSLAVLDHDQTAASRSLVDALTSGEYFARVEDLGSESALQPALVAGKATIVVVIPEGFARDLAAGRPPSVQALIDGSNASLAQTAQGYVEAYVSAVGARLAGTTPAAQPVSLRQQVLYNPELASERFLLPGLVAFILGIAATIATALAVVKERETGTMEMLLVSPLQPTELILGKSIPYGIVAMFAASLVLLTARLVFGLHVAGSLPLLWLLMGLFILGAQGLGLLISSITTSQQVAFQLATFATTLPTFLLSGFIFPIRSMPLPIRLVTFLLPARYLVKALREIILKGAGLSVIWPELLALSAFSAVTMGLAVWRLERMRP